MKTVFVTVQVLVFLVKDIDEWNILSLKNNIIVNKKRSKIEDGDFQLFIYAIWWQSERNPNLGSRQTRLTLEFWYGIWKESHDVQRFLKIFEEMTFYSSKFIAKVSRRYIFFFLIRTLSLSLTTHFFMLNILPFGIY